MFIIDSARFQKMAESACNVISTKIILLSDYQKYLSNIFLRKKL